MLHLKHPFTAVVSGPSGCGKSRFCLRLIKNSSSMIHPPPKKIYWHYGIYQSGFNSSEYKSVEFHEGLPNLEQVSGNSTPENSVAASFDREPILLVLDDLMSEVDDSVAQIFTRGSHHLNVSILYITQNLFQQNKHSRTINLNSHYIVLFKNPRDVTQISYLGRQMYPKKSTFLVDAFKDATSKAYGYLFLDLKADTDEQLRVRTSIFPDDKWHYVYVPR